MSMVLGHNVVGLCHGFVELGRRAQCAQCTRRRAGCDTKKSALQHHSDYIKRSYAARLEAKAGGRGVPHKNGSFTVSTATELKPFGSGLVDRSNITILIAGTGTMRSGRVWDDFRAGCAC